jgi:2-amino-4-hydroxy-6-hydroxymethyldihydropteridine diphosphokinase
MQFNEWEQEYLRILDDMGYDRREDENSVRIIKALTMNSYLVDDDFASGAVGDTVTVFGDSPGLEDDIGKHTPEGTLIAAGSCVGRLLRCGYTPDIVVTDLDGEIQPQIDTNCSGALTLVHAHGDNADLICRYVSLLKGPIILTTQSNPGGSVLNYGGFTDGDRAVCFARHFGARRILLLGFDFDHPNPKPGSDPDVKRKKLIWAKKIIFDGSTDIILP